MVLAEAPGWRGFMCVRCTPHPETRAAHDRTHLVFDRLWRGDAAVMSRDGAYRWLGGLLGVPESEAHIGRLDETSCDRVIAAATVLIAGSTGVAFRERLKREKSQRRRGGHRGRARE